MSAAAFHVWLAVFLSAGALLVLLSAWAVASARGSSGVLKQIVQQIMHDREKEAAGFEAMLDRVSSHRKGDDREATTVAATHPVAASAEQRKVFFPHEAQVLFDDFLTCELRDFLRGRGPHARDHRPTFVMLLRKALRSAVTDNRLTSVPDELRKFCGYVTEKVQATIQKMAMALIMRQTSAVRLTVRQRKAIIFAAYGGQSLGLPEYDQRLAVVPGSIVVEFGNNELRFETTWGLIRYLGSAESSTDD